MEEGMVSDKKNRVTNYSASDRALLLKIVNKKDIIENKKTHAYTWKQKEREWTKVQDEFNCSSTGPARTAKQLKYKYESIKKDFKKKHGMHSAYMRGTGGGPYIPPPSPPKTTEEKILSQTIAHGVQGLSSNRDADGLAGISGIIYHQSVDILENEDGSYNEEQTAPNKRQYIAQEVELDWSEPNSSLLQTSKSAILKPSIENEAEHNYYTVVEAEYELPTVAEEQSTEAENQPPKKTPPQPWHSRRRPVLQKKKCLSSAGARFEVLATKKEELVLIQKAVVQEQMAEQREEHNKRLILLDLQIEEQRLKDQLLVNEQRAEQREEHKKRLLLLDLQIEGQRLKNQLLVNELNKQK